jgi:hypothetical protein
VVSQSPRSYGDGHSTRQRIKDWGVPGAKLNDFLQLLVRYVGTDFELDPNSLISLANARIEVKESVRPDWPPDRDKRRIAFAEMAGMPL